MERTEFLPLFFLMAFTLHNIEEALWLPRWSARAGRFHAPVEPDRFRFAVIIITALSYLLVFLHLMVPSSVVFRYAYYGLVLVMMVNVVAPHLAATIALKSYSPGLFTGLLLLIPAGTAIIMNALDSEDAETGLILISAVITAVFLLLVIKLCFRLSAYFTGAE